MGRASPSKSAKYPGWVSLLIIVGFVIIADALVIAPFVLFSK